MILEKGNKCQFIMDQEIFIFKPFLLHCPPKFLKRVAMLMLSNILVSSFFFFFLFSLFLFFFFFSFSSFFLSFLSFFFSLFLCSLFLFLFMFLFPFSFLFIHLFSIHLIPDPNNCVVCYFGDGAASEGDFHAGFFFLFLWI